MTNRHCIPCVHRHHESEECECICHKVRRKLSAEKAKEYSESLARWVEELKNNPELYASYLEECKLWEETIQDGLEEE